VKNAGKSLPDGAGIRATQPAEKRLREGVRLRLRIASASRLTEHLAAHDPCNRTPLYSQAQR
jgi:hypothetical protein